MRITRREAPAYQARDRMDYGSRQIWMGMDSKPEYGRGWQLPAERTESCVFPFCLFAVARGRGGRLLRGASVLRIPGYEPIRCALLVRPFGNATAPTAGPMAPADLYAATVPLGRRVSATRIQ